MMQLSLLFLFVVLGNIMIDQSQIQYLQSKIAEVPDFPKKGILFKDITPILLDPKAFQICIEALEQKVKAHQIDMIAGIEARGFIFGVALAQKMNLPFIPVRKAGKLPRKTTQVSYALEYGEDRIEIHSDDIAQGSKVLIVDDLLATGGTAQAAMKLIEKQGAQVVAFSFVIELHELNGKDKLGQTPIYSLF
jgi:adenine phosphoribosyltransferase